MNSNMTNRMISGAFIGAIFITSIFFFRGLFYGLLFFMFAAMMKEWSDMTGRDISSAAQKYMYLALGLVIIFPAIYALYYISSLDEAGWILFLYFVLIWCVDMFAMFGGKSFKGPKLAPKISPNKTISGLICGVFMSTSFCYFIFVNIPAGVNGLINICSDISIIYWFMLLGMLAQGSDLFISIFKRKFNIKDSGSIIPGHGGMLDRFDSIIFSAPVLALMIMSCQG